MDVTPMKKKGGARFMDVDTYKVSCEANKLQALESFKSADEVGSHDSEFVHVMRAVLTEHNRFQVVVKVHFADNYFITKELAMMDKLKGYTHAVQKLCDFRCQDDKTRWMRPLKRPKSLCKPSGKDALHFVVMQFIQDGDVTKWLGSLSPSKPEILSFFAQAALVIAEVAFTYGVYHGDLNSGNILLAKTESPYQRFRILDRTYKVKTFGRTPVLIDFGRGGEYEGKPKNRMVLDDIYIMLSVLTNYVVDQDLKGELRAFVMSESAKKKNKVADFMDALISKVGG